MVRPAESLRTLRTGGRVEATDWDVKQVLDYVADLEFWLEAYRTDSRSSAEVARAQQESAASR